MVTWDDVEKYLFKDYWIKNWNCQILCCTLVGYDEKNNKLIFDAGDGENEFHIPANKIRLENYVKEDGQND
nr:hypothetical protein DGKKSRWO_DGKKSRWO_CDS_0154 [uncultured phage]CAI9752333.1 hypothetical protein CVNMHQAP_CVNMHQAP_CDS_0156 [uncultured phage]